MEKTLEQLLDEYKRLGTVGLEQGPPMPPAPEPAIEQAPVRSSIASPKSYSSIVNPEEADLEMPVPQEYDIPTKSQMSEDESLVNPNLQRPMMFNKSAVTQEDLPPVSGASREPASEPTPNYSDAALLHDAQTAEINNRLMAGLSRSGALVGTAFANMGQQKPAASVDETGYKNLSDMAGAPMDQFKAGQSLKDSLISRKAKELDLEDEKAMRQPNSPVSKALRDAARLVGLNVSDDTTGAQLKLGFAGGMGTLLSAHQMAQARKQNAELAREERAEAREARKSLHDDDRDVRYTSKTGDALNKLEAKQKEATANIDLAMVAADTAPDSPTTSTNLARFVVKAVEGSGAKVSNEDAKTALRAGGVSEEAVARIWDAMSGTIPEFQAEDVKKMMKVLKKFNQEQYSAARDAIVKRSVPLMKNKDEKQLRRELLFEDQEDKPTQQIPTTVRVRNPKTNQIKLIPADQLDAALKAGGERVD